MAIFEDSNQAAEWHLLIVPVEHIKSINTLENSDIELLNGMKNKSMEILIDKMKIQKKEIDYNKIRIGFHRVLSTSIDHLHMHAFLLPFKSWFWTGIVKFNRFFFV